jgi:hypothetical protein
MIKARKKSTNPPNMEAIGMVRRGKYIFFIISALFTILFEAWLILFEKKVHGTRAAKLNIG